MKIEFRFLKSFFYFYLGLYGIRIEIEPLEVILEKRNSDKRVCLLFSCFVINGMKVIE